MQLYLGGAENGKLEYVLEKTGNSPAQVAEGGTADWECLCSARILHNFHLWIRRELAAGTDRDTLKGRTAELLQKNPDVCIILDEIGCGIVPMDAFERNYRELTGRISCMLAKQAEQVIRIQCGIGQVLK